MSTISTSYSLRRRMLVRSALLLLVVFVLLSIGAWHYAKQAANYSYDRLLRSASLSMLEGVHVTGANVDIDIPYASFEMMQLSSEDKVFYRVQGPQGNFITGYENFPLPNQSLGKERTLFYDANYLSEHIRVVMQRKWLSEPEVSGWVSVYLGQTLNARDQMRNDILVRSLATLLGIMLLVLFVLWWSINRALEPLSTISKSLFTQTSFSETPLDKTSIQEVAPLVDAINEYQTRLASNLDGMKTFIADASHQIRTVQSATQAQLDIASQSQDLSQLPAHLGRIREEHLRLTRLTNQLLSHAMVVHRGDTRIVEDVNMESLVKQLLTECVRDYAHTEIEFSYHCDGRIGSVQGDWIALKEAFRNLLENSLVYGPAKNQIDVSLTQEAGHVNVIIDDQGPGIPQAQREQAVQRFKRLTTRKEGSGLGLAIVSSVVESHEGRFFLEDSPLGGLRARVQLRVGES
ncbi:sensor histidine kinase [Marinomonas spartinae]|uniref:sensor histidine kinase n=1 Tax=Marinomonas spartinae TaxID=1792290 RepID=UPI0018F1E215|nr:sensor histidine kinase [Marinomonas spartinae]MBJ7554813.1 sensor histidine kinase [Marinomonas spartinae]